MSFKKGIKKIDEKYFGGVLHRIYIFLKKSPSKLMYNENYYNRKKNYPYRSYEALSVLTSNFDFDTVLDIGCGEGIHSQVFLEHGKAVTALDYGESVYFKKMKKNNNIELIVADFNSWISDKQFDCVWCSHVLEHQLNANIFLKKIFSLLKEGGVLAISVPPLKQEIVGGHVSLWTPGILLYNLVLAGFDCSDAMIKTYDYDISIIVRKRGFKMPALEYDCGDIRKLTPFLPKGLDFHQNEVDDPFDGNIAKLNWNFEI